MRSLIGVLIVAAAFCGCSREEGVKAAAPTAAPAESAKPIAATNVVAKAPSPLRAKSTAKPAKSKAAPKAVAKQPVLATEDRTDLSASDKATLLTIEKAMEEEDAKILKSALAEARKSGSVEIRQEAVDALGWFGKPVMEELLPFMADSNEDIAQSALDNWTSALGEFEDEKVRCTMIEDVMKVLKNPDSLESLVMELNDCDEKLAMQSLVNIIACGNEPAIKAAKEHYEFMTGDEYTTVEAAEKWIRENSSDDED